MDPTTVGVIGTTLSAFFVGLFGWLGVRDKRTREIADKATENIDTLRTDLAAQRARLDVAMVHIYELRRVMIENNLALLPLPIELTTAPAPPVKAKDEK